MSVVQTKQNDVPFLISRPNPAQNNKQSDISKMVAYIKNKQNGTPEAPDHVIPQLV
jgi:hypothetical protein